MHITEEKVPLNYPFGSITDGEWKCGRCGAYVTGCYLCAGKKIILVKERNE